MAKLGEISSTEDMQSTSEITTAMRIAQIRLECEREIPIQLDRADSAQIFSRKLLDSAKSEAQQAMQLQEKLGKLKVEMRDADDALGKVLAEKARKEAKRTMMMESISATKAKVEELRRIVEDQRARRDDYAAIISQQSGALTACKENHDRDREHREHVTEAISWYKRVLGFRIECGNGVKFIFTNINRANPEEEYSFTVRHDKNIYTLLDCDPHLRDTDELVHELNKSNELFKFVRTMRMKFQQAAAHGASLHGHSTDQDSSRISLSEPAASVSSYHNGYKTPIKEKRFQLGDSDKESRKNPKNQTKRSPGSASSLRRSSRLKKGTE